MPPVERGEYLLTYLWEIGPVMAGGMSSMPITQVEIRAWQDNIGIRLQPWEVRCIRRLSLEYLSESRKAEKRDRFAPWGAVDIKPEPSELQRSLRALANL